MEIKSKIEYRFLSYVRDNPGVKVDILKMLNVSPLRVGWRVHSRRAYENVAKNKLITIHESECFLTEEGKKELETYEKSHSSGKRGIIEHKHESEKIRFVSES